MAQSHWKTKYNDVKIPVWGSPERKQYDAAFANKLHEVFSDDRPMRKLKLPLAQIDARNMPVNKERLSLYTRMAQAERRLPPIVVRRNGDTYDAIDGNHRLAAARAVGLRGLDAYEIQDPPEFQKMALEDIKLGRKGNDRQHIPYQGTIEKQYYNYTHVLPHHAGYAVRVYPKVHDDGSCSIQSHVLHGKDTVGMLDGTIQDGRLEIHASHIKPEHRGKGLGLALYEALYAHARNGLGATNVVGATHSTLASSVHKRLASKHGLDYHARPNFGPDLSTAHWETQKEWEDAGKTSGGSYDERFAPYRYALKSEPKSLAHLRALPEAQQAQLLKTVRMLQKAEANNLLAKTTDEDGEDASHEVASAMLGFKPHAHRAFEAARFLTGSEPAALERIRRSLWDHDGDPVAAAMDVYGMAPTDASRKAVVAHGNVRDLWKGEEQPPKLEHAVAVVPASVDTATCLNRAIASNSVQPVKLNGKHSTGSMLATDPESHLTWLLKPNTGGVSPAKGVQEETVNQARREAAYWQIARLAGLDGYFPQADAVHIASSDGKSHEYAAVLMLPYDWKPVEDWREQDPNWVTRCLEKYRQDGTMHQWAALDFVLGNPDRHWGNALMHDTDIKLIDQGSAFAGKDFAPGSDRNSFVPFYLRYRNPTLKFNKLSPEAKMRWMPSVAPDVDEMLRVWVKRIDPNVVASVLRTYGIHPDATVQRLKHLQAVPEGTSMSQVINLSWTK